MHIKGNKPKLFQAETDRLSDHFNGYWMYLPLQLRNINDCAPTQSLKHL